MQVGDRIEALVSSLKRLEKVEQAYKRECCGFGGTFAVKQPAISAAMVKDKTADIRQTGSARFISGDCGCLMNISGAMKHAGVAVAGKHLAEFVNHDGPALRRVVLVELHAVGLRQVPMLGVDEHTFPRPQEFRVQLSVLVLGGDRQHRRPHPVR